MNSLKYGAILGLAFITMAGANAMPRATRHGVEIFLPFCFSVPEPYYSGVLPAELGPFDSDAQLIVGTSDRPLGTMNFGGGVEAYDVLGESERGCGVDRVWQQNLAWLRPEFVPVGFCSSKYGQPHKNTYLSIIKKEKGKVFQIDGLFAGGLNPDEQMIRATASFARMKREFRPGEKMEVSLRLLAQRSDGSWNVIQEDVIPVSNPFERKTWEISRRDVATGTPIRFEMNTVQDGFGDLRLYDARLYGAQCYPDFSNSETCL